MSGKERRRQSKASEGAQGREIELGWGAIAVAAIGLVAVAALAWFVAGRPGTESSTGGTGASTDGGAVAVPTAAREPGAWFTSDGDPALGSTSAPVTLIAYSDYQCPNCRQFALEVLPWLRQRWMGEGLVRVVFRDFAIRGDESHLAAQAAHCAGEQGLYWTYHDALFAAQSGENQGTFSAHNLAAIARSVGLDSEEIAACLQSGRHAARVVASTKAAYDQGYEGTPTYLVNGRQTQGAIEIDRWEELFLLFAADIATATAGAGAAP